ncbi:hypothetical protein QCD60_27010 [Pokkaliibacter sp. MBI-7]|uniref:hypothetical protein n=1 Tax=Pokkaliibacter sp. MBI-7 TaxID=3040600 RepID=UPI0024498429|nr:hypothetical protein [Pokkaliibacter sp. MBI-7]MDH2436187.1 hypothetical protein [Pokkaliibacter sp. MBI-7]
MVRSVAPTPSFQSVEHLRQSNIDTKALLRHGSLSIGGTQYRVSVNTDDQIQVRREDSWGKPACKKFFGAAKDMFNHRLKDGSAASRSERIADVLNQRHVPDAPLPSMFPRQHKTELDIGDFNQSEHARAREEGTTYRQENADEAFAAYKASRHNSPQSSPAHSTHGHHHSHHGHNEPLRRTRSDELPAKSFSEFKQEFEQVEQGRLDYHGETSSGDNTKRAYQDYQAQRRFNQSAPSSPFRSEPVRSEPQRTESAAEQQASADYYGHSAGLSKWDTMLLQSEAELAARRRSEQRTMPGVTLQHAHSAPAQLETVGRLSTRELKNQAVDAAVRLSGNNLTFAVSILEKVDALRNSHAISHANKREALETFIDILSNKDLGTTMSKLQDLNRILDGAGRHQR